MRVLLTGGSGFIGSALITYLLTKGACITALGRRPIIHAGVKNILLPELTPDLIQNALQHCVFDLIIHLAAAGVNPHDRDNRHLININVILPEFLVRQATNCGAKAVILAGSSSEYAVSRQQEKLTEQSPLETEKLYGATKAAGGILALSQGATINLPVAVVRLFNVYGFGEAPHRLSSTLITHLSAGKKAALSPGKQIRDFVYIEDVCTGLWRIGQALLSGQLPRGAYNLATSIGTSIADFARRMAYSLESSEQLLDFGAISTRPDDLPYVVGDNSRLKKLINWQPAWTLDAGLRDLLTKHLLPTIMK